ncbi:MAG: bifunctional 4-hydroxy-2-oxoglutarate aldolase/2-dehydro-3-deoxy-phosphogluconate aldolase [Elsteraceae bacterium]
MSTDAILKIAPLIPVVTISDAAQAVPMARALVAGGLPVIEITLRTPAALGAIRRIAAEVPEAIVGAGTVLRPADFEAARAAGARFAVSPGSTALLASAAVDCGLPWLPGIATPSEAMTLRERGFLAMKFFPANTAGGAAFLSHIHAILPDLVFCPTGGVTLETMGSLLKLPNVLCVGASFVASSAAIAAGDWSGVTERARAAAAIRAA